MKASRSFVPLVASALVALVLIINLVDSAQNQTTNAAADQATNSSIPASNVPSSNGTAVTTPDPKNVTPSTPKPTPAPKELDGNLSTGIIAIIIIAGVVVGAGIIGFLCLRYYKKSGQANL